MTDPVLKLDNVTKSYWRGTRELKVLRSISLEVGPGELFAVYGQRGAGKTTLLRMAAGFEPPDDGRVMLGDRDLAQVSHNALAKLHRASIAWVDRAGQQSRELDVQTYVALPMYRSHGPKEAQRRAHATLERVGAADVAAERWESLSDTSRTLVSIAHALIRQPRLLLIDDPAGGLNVIDRERVAGLLRSAAEDDGCAVLTVVPDFPSMHHAHEVRSLSRGRLVVPAERPKHGDGASGGTVVEFPGSERSA